MLSFFLTSRTKVDVRFFPYYCLSFCGRRAEHKYKHGCISFGPRKTLRESTSRSPLCKIPVKIFRGMKVVDNSKNNSYLYDLIQYLENLDYFPRRVALTNTIKSKLPRYLYKYRGTFSANSNAVDHFRDILVRSKLWLSSPVDFNDPFDTAAFFYIPKEAKAKKNRFKELAKSQGLKREEADLFSRKMMRRSHKKVEAELQAIFEKMLKKTGIFSFAGDPRNILMWSHYANNHEGFCIQFEVAQDVRLLSQALDVEYSLQYPSVNWVEGFEKSLIPVMLRKHIGWAYEQEARLVQPGRAHQHMSILPHSVSAIIFGCKMRKDEKAAVKILLKEREADDLPSVKLYQAKQHKTDYRLQIFATEL